MSSVDMPSPSNAQPSSQQPLDTQQFLTQLDQLFATHAAATQVERYLLDSLRTTQQAHDAAGEFTVLNEILGFYRSQGMHEKNIAMVEQLITLAQSMHIEGSEAWTTTLINVATAYRAAGDFEQAKHWYSEALSAAEQTFGSHDRRLAALHNNLSMLYSETGELARAAAELEQALTLITQASTDPSRDIDVASTHTNLALVLAQLDQQETRQTQKHNTDGERNQNDEFIQNSEHDHLNELNQDGVHNQGREQYQDGVQDADDSLSAAYRHAAQALYIYHNGGLENSGHFASALAGFAQVCFLKGDLRQAITAFRLSLVVIEQCYGKHTESYQVIESNLQDVLHIAQQAHISIPQEPQLSGNFADNVAVFWNLLALDEQQTNDTTLSVDGTEQPQLTGLQLSRAYWQEYGKPMLDTFPQLQGRVAVGLVGHGSECYGFDDEYSHDHDFGPRFCMWLTDEDYKRYGEQLEHAYRSLPQEFMGYRLADDARTPRSQGAAHRDGVFAIGDFFESITGYRQSPSDDPEHAHQWLLLDEATLAAATNGEIFADPLGAFSSRRQGFKNMPEDVRLALISKRLGMISQAGQYNVPRMLRRHDGAAAMLAIHEFVKACSSLVFLINNPISVGYMPYYKWQFAALRKLSKRMATRLPEIVEQLESLMRLSSAACFGGVGFGEGGKGADPAIEQIQAIIDTICREIVDELLREGLTRSRETFLEWQRPYIEEHIANPWLHSV